MIKYFLFVTIIFVKIPLSAQSDKQENGGIRLVSKPCTNVMNMQGIPRWHYFSGISRDSSIRQRLSESLALRPFEVDEGIQISFSKEGMKSILKVLHFKRKFKNYIWQLATCQTHCHNCGIPPIQRLDAKEVMGVGFEVSESNKITITSYNHFYPYRAKVGLYRRYQRTGQNLFTKTLLENVMVKSARLNNVSIKAEEDLWIYYPIDLLSKKEVKNNID